MVVRIYHRNHGKIARFCANRQLSREDSRFTAPFMASLGHGEIPYRRRRTAPQDMFSSRIDGQRREESKGLMRATKRVHACDLHTLRTSYKPDRDRPC